MAQMIKYSAADKKKYITFEWAGRGNGMAAVRCEKMLRPICNTCQKGLDTLVGWEKTCEHEPYWSLQPKVIKTPKYETDEDGDLVLVDTEIRTKMVKIPNIAEIVISPRHNDGRGVEKQKAKGFIPVTSGGVAPMCDMYGCGRAWPAIRTNYGDYCSELHAKLCVADALEIKFTVNDGKVYQQELAGVTI